MRDFSSIKPRIAILAVGLSGLLVALAFLALRVIRGMGEFQLAHFHFNYGVEFLRRGLAGEILRQIGFPLSNLNISLLYSAAVVVFLLLLILACAGLFARLPARTGVLFMIFMLACPGLTLHYAYSSYGYLDIFLLLLTGAGLWLIGRTGFVPALAVTIAFSAVSILIHEIALFITVPALGAGLMLRHATRIGLSGTGLIFGALVVFTMLVWHFGQADTLTFEEHTAALTAAISPTGETSTFLSGAVIILHRTLAENVGLVLPASPWWYIWQQVKFAIFAAPYLFFVTVTLLAADAQLSGSGKRLAGAAFVAAVAAPVALYLVGHDYFRWWSAAAANYFMLVFFLCRQHPEFLERLAGLIERYRAVMIVGILVGLTMGGIGGLVSFSIHTAPAAMAYRMIF